MKTESLSLRAITGGPHETRAPKKPVQTERVTLHLDPDRINLLANFFALTGSPARGRNSRAVYRCIELIEEAQSGQTALVRILPRGLDVDMDNEMDAIDELHKRNCQDQGTVPGGGLTSLARFGLELAGAMATAIKTADDTQAIISLGQLEQVVKLAAGTGDAGAKSMLQAVNTAKAAPRTFRFFVATPPPTK